jgi:AcrR family transcriptional regulator
MWFSNKETGCGSGDWERRALLARATEGAGSPIESTPRLYKKLRPGPGRSASEVSEHQRARIQSAMLEILAEGGYGAVTVRELAQVAGISSRAFYQNYTGKEECFLRTHEMVVRCILRRIDDAQADEVNSRERLRVTLNVFLDELQRAPRAARLLLIDGYVAGSMALAQVRRTEQRLETRVLKCVGLAVSKNLSTLTLGRGIIVGVMSVARSRLSMSYRPTFTRLADTLADWVIDVVQSFQRNASQGQSPHARLRDTPEHIGLLSPSETRQWAADSDRALIMAALARLAASENYDEITVTKIRGSAGASSKKFAAHFRGVPDCFQAVVDLYISRGIPRLFSEHYVNGPSGQWLNETIALLCELVACDPAFANLCFVDIFGPGLAGTRSLDHLFEELSGLLLNDPQKRHSEFGPVTEAGTAAVWGVIREGLIAKRQFRVSELATFLRTSMTAPLAELDRLENIHAQNLTNSDPNAMLIPRAEPLSSVPTVTTK